MNLLKKILSYGAVEGIAKLLNKLTLFLIPLILIDSKALLGKIGLIISIETLIPLLTLIGFDRIILRFYNEKEKYYGFLKTIFSSVFISHFIIFLVLIICYLFSIKSFFEIDIFPDFLLISLLVFFQSYFTIILNILRVDQSHKLYFSSRLLFQFTKVLNVIFFTYYLKSHLGYLYGSIIAIVLIFIFLIFKKDKINLNLKTNFDNKTFKKFINFSWPFIFHGIAVNLVGNADKFVIKGFLSFEDLGLYTFIYSIGTSISLAFSAVTIYMEPLIYKESDKEKREQLLSQFNFYSIIIAILFLFIIGFISNNILNTTSLFKKEYGNVLIFIPTISSAYIVFPYYLKANYRLIYNKSSKTIASMSIISAVLNIIMNILFIPIYGIYASIIITIISFIFQATVFILISNKFKWKKEYVNLIFISIILVVSSLFKFHYLMTCILLLVPAVNIYLSEIKQKNI